MGAGRARAVSGGPCRWGVSRHQGKQASCLNFDNSHWHERDERKGREQGHSGPHVRQSIVSTEMRASVVWCVTFKSSQQSDQNYKKTGTQAKNRKAGSSVKSQSMPVTARIHTIT